MREGRFNLDVFNPITSVNFVETEIKGSIYFTAIPGERYSLRLSITKTAEDPMDNYLKVEMRIDDQLVHTQTLKPEQMFFILVDSIRIDNKTMQFTWAKKPSMASAVGVQTPVSNEFAGRFEIKVWKGTLAGGQIPTVSSTASANNQQNSIYTAFVEKIDDSKVEYSDPPYAIIIAYYHTADMLELMAGKSKGVDNPSTEAESCCIIL